MYAFGVTFEINSEKITKSKDYAKEFFDAFFNMKIDPIRNADDAIEYVLTALFDFQVAA